MASSSKQDEISVRVVLGPLHEACRNSSDDVDVVLDTVDNEGRRLQDG